MSEEQALAILQICKYKISTSKLLMQQYTPEIDEWTAEEKCLFEQAYKFYGKIFSRIRQMLPDKSVGDLVRYYYSWKKTRLHKSIMDKHEKQNRLLHQNDDDTDDDDKDIPSIPLPTKDLDHRGRTPIDQSGTDEQECCNCEVTNVNDNIGPMHSTPKGVLCDACYLYWHDSGLMRPELYPSKSTFKKIKRPPKNMALDLDSLIAMNSYDNMPTSNTDLNEIIDPVDKLEGDIHHELSLIQAHTQAIELLLNQSRNENETMRIPFRTSSSTIATASTTNNSNATTTTTTSTWSTEEILLAIQAFGKYGKDFDAVARIVGPTKTVADVESFFLECRERYQLDLVIEINSKPITNSQRKQASTTNNDINSNRSNPNDIVLVS
ncbi:hypothetical protein I4U23_029676 [Adineta vaga]|nr:hypothetical protein I4U23_029676 [Adineta vaga]